MLRRKLIDTVLNYHKKELTVYESKLLDSILAKVHTLTQSTLLLAANNGETTTLIAESKNYIPESIFNRLKIFIDFEIEKVLGEKLDVELHYPNLENSKHQVLHGSETLQQNLVTHIRLRWMDESKLPELTRNVLSQLLCHEIVPGRSDIHLSVLSNHVTERKQENKQ